MIDDSVIRPWLYCISEDCSVADSGAAPEYLKQRGVTAIHMGDTTDVNRC